MNEKSPVLIPLAVVGGGISGLAAALELGRSGRFEVTLYEKDETLGGLCAPYFWNGKAAAVDRAYHVILPADANTISFVESLGLGGDLSWKDSRSGFFRNGRLVPFATAADFARFPFLSPAEKLRLGLGIFSTARGRRRPAPDRTAPEWLREKFGPSVTAKFWEPLLRAKLGDARARTPASFMQATIRRLYGARGKSGNRERMGAVRGGYAPVIAAAGRRLREAGVEIKTGIAVRRIVHGEGRWLIEAADGRRSFERVLVTAPVPEAIAFIDVKGSAYSAAEYWGRLARVEYLGLVSVLVILKRSLSPFYLINLLDLDMPFTGVIESTNVLGTESAGGRSLVYLPKYATRDDPLLERPDGYIEALFLGRLRLMFPGLSPTDIIHVRTFRNRFAQPIPSLGQPVGELGVRTPLRGLYLAGTAFIDDSTANNDAAIRAARGAAAAIIADS
jgi:protoporphyrinogen oxidase